VKLDDADIKALDEIHKTKGTTRFVYPAFGVKFGFPDKDE
jgi:glycerol 2-dehydrogenase (NADP+)